MYKLMSLPYPNGLVGQPWTPAASGWPGVDGISSDRNYLPVNTYPVDPQTQPAINSRAPPADIWYKGGSRRRRTRRTRRTRKRKATKGKRRRSRRRGSGGGGLMNDFIEPIGYQMRGAYNVLNGMASPTDPRAFIQPNLQ